MKISTILFLMISILLTTIQSLAADINYDETKVDHQFETTHDLGFFYSQALLDVEEIYSKQEKKITQQIVAASAGPLLGINGTKSFDKISIPFTVESSGRYTIKIKLSYDIKMWDFSTSLIFGAHEKIFYSYIQSGVAGKGLGSVECCFHPDKNEYKKSLLGQAVWNTINGVLLGTGISLPSQIEALKEVCEIVKLAYDVSDIDERQGSVTLTYQVDLDASNSYQVYLDFINECVAVADGLAGNIASLDSTAVIEELQIIPDNVSHTNQRPVLSHPRITPDYGKKDTTFEYTVHYYDPDADTPIINEVNIDGETYSMSLKSGDAYNGIYSFETNLHTGTHRFFFYFAENNGGSVITPIYTGPKVYTKDSTVEVDVMVAYGPTTENIEIEFRHGPELSDMKSYEWNAKNLPKVVEVEPLPQQLGFFINLESDNHTINGWICRDDNGDVVSESSDWSKIFELLSGNVHATAYLTYTPNNYTTSGTVLREDGSPVPGDLKLTLTSLVQTLTTTSNNGTFSFTGVKGGVPVTITPSAVGYAFSPPNIIYSNLKDNHSGVEIKAYSSDTKAPTTSLTKHPYSVNEESSVTFAWTGQDDVTINANLQYQYKLDRVDADWSDWTSAKTKSYDLENGTYTFWVRAKDEALNINQAPESYTFVINADPKVVSTERINGSVWASRLTLELPAITERLSNIFILLPSHSCANDPDLVPVKIYRVTEDTPIGVNEIIADKTGLPSIIEKTETGWKVTISNDLGVNLSAQYDVVWGKVAYFGWQEFTDVPIGFPSGGNITRAYLDEDLRLWRNAINRVDRGGQGNACETDTLLLMNLCESGGDVIDEQLMRFVPGITTEYYNSNPEKPRGIYYQFWMQPILKENSKVFFPWHEQKEVWNAPRYDRYSRFGLQIFNTDGSSITMKDGDYIFKASDIHFSKEIINGILWVVGDKRGSDNKDNNAWFLGLDENGNEAIPRTVFDTIDKDTFCDLGDINIKPIGNNVILLWERSWDTTSEEYERQELMYMILDQNGSIVKQKTSFHDPIASDSADFDDEYTIENCLTDDEGKVWISFTHESTETGNRLYNHYYVILDKDGSILKGPIGTPGPGAREFRFCDKDGYIWVEEDGQFFALNPDDSIHVAPRTPAWFPSQRAGQALAQVNREGYRIFDRWSPQPIFINIPSNTTISAMEIYDLNLWDNDLHCSDVLIKKGDIEIWNKTGLFNDQAAFDVSNTLNNGLNFLSIVQEDFLGGQVLITFPYVNKTDTDNDGLPDSLEDTTCTNPNNADTDNDGIMDGVEDANQNGIVDSGETDPCNIDTDGDGIQDGTELGYTQGHATDTDLDIFQPDLDPTTTTEPLNDDTDGDGLLDGQEDINHNGRLDAGESDPTMANSPAALSVDMDMATRDYDDTVSSKDIEQTIFVPENDEAWVAVVAQGVTNLDTYQVEVSFDTEKVEFIEGVEEDPSEGIENLLERNGGETSGFQAVENVSGTIHIENALTQQDCGDAPEGTGIIALLKFRVVDTNQDNHLTLDNAFFTDCNDNQQEVTNLENGTFTSTQSQIVSIKPDVLNTTMGSSLRLTVNYDVSDNDNTLSAIGVRIHFDSTKLEYNTFEDLFETNKLADPQLEDDVNNEDNDENTDKIMVLSYADFINNSWPNEPLPLDLVTFLFTVKNDAPEGLTNVNVTNVTGHTGYGFVGNGSVIDIGRCNLDVDGNGAADGGTDGIMLIRYLFEIKGDALIYEAVAPGCTRCTAEDIEAYLNRCGYMLDVDGNGAADGGTDGIMLIRYLFEIKGDALIYEAVASDCTRCTADYIEGFLLSFIP